MTSLTADEKILEFLGQAKELAEIRDSAGTLIGIFAPVDLKTTQVPGPGASKLDREEIERRKNLKEKSYSSKEVFEHLKSLTEDEGLLDYLQKKIDGLLERDQCATR